MRYAIRKLEGNFWVDVLEFDDARQFEPSDAVEVVGGRMASLYRSCTTVVRGG